MTSRDFCYWLQGYFEISNETVLSPNATQIVKNHLAMVFKHEIDPSFGDNKIQEALNNIHSSDTLIRCCMTYYIPITKHKGLEFQLSKFNTYSWFEFSFFWTRRCDHAGLKFTFSIYNYSLDINLQDCRHWNHFENRWYKDGELGNE